jgi:hypothetical protein
MTDAVADIEVHPLLGSGPAGRVAVIVTPREAIDAADRMIVRLFYRVGPAILSLVQEGGIIARAPHLHEFDMSHDRVAFVRVEFVKTLARQKWRPAEST